MGWRRDLLLYVGVAAFASMMGVIASQAWRAQNARPVVEHVAQGLVRGDKLVVFATSTCRVCADARTWLDGLGIDYVEKTIDTSPLSRQLARQLGVDIVPTFVFGTVRINGFSKPDLERLTGIGEPTAAGRARVPGESHRAHKTF